MSVAISRVLIHREYSRLHQDSLASLAHLRKKPLERMGGAHSENDGDDERGRGH